MRRLLSSIKLKVLLCLIVQLGEFQGSCAVFEVTTNTDTGVGSFRAAIENANQNTGADSITFLLAPSNRTILLTTALPAVTEQINLSGSPINLYSDPATSTSLDRPQHSLVLSNHFGSSISQLTFAGFPTTAVTLQNCTSCSVSTCYFYGSPIGPQSAVRLEDCTSCTVGRLRTSSQGNGYSASLYSNYFVTYHNAVTVEGGSGNQIFGSYFREEPYLPRGLRGIYILNSANNEIGRGIAGANSIFYNQIAGVHISGSASFGNKICGNNIGSVFSGLYARGNEIGVLIDDGAHDNIVGGESFEAGNLISSNLADGVVITGASTTGNRILSNSIHSNGGRGINLDAGITTGSVTNNDLNDADSGPNGFQNFPVLNAYALGATNVSGTLNAAAQTSYTVQLFGTLIDPIGKDAASYCIGTQSVLSDSSGNANFTFPLARPIARGQYFSATATDPQGSTSELSLPAGTPIPVKLSLLAVE